MSRTRRPYLPGTAFHVYARTIGRAAWFNDEVRDAVVGIIADALRRTDARLLAFVVMPNHFHLVVQQGRDPLSRLMQPICRRTALAVHRVRKRAGRIFERRYYARVCTDAGYVRSAIAYVHRNPLARLCAAADEYAWSSHRCYTGQPVGCGRSLNFPNVSPAVSLFADDADQATHRAAYDRYMQWRDDCARCERDVPRPVKPSTRHGNAFWAAHYSKLPRQLNGKPDLRDIVLRTLREVAPEMTLDELLLRRGGQTVVQARRTAIARCVLAGHRGVDIAAFLNVSASTVSRVSVAAWANRGT